MQGVSETTRHTCCHCQQDVLTVDGCRPFRNAEKLKWRVPLKRGPEAVRQAALSGCPFYVRAWDERPVTERIGNSFGADETNVDRIRARSFAAAGDHRF